MRGDRLAGVAEAHGLAPEPGLEADEQDGADARPEDRSAVAMIADGEDGQTEDLEPDDDRDTPVDPFDPGLGVVEGRESWPWQSGQSGQPSPESVARTITPIVTRASVVTRVARARRLEAGHETAILAAATAHPGGSRYAFGHVPHPVRPVDRGLAAPRRLPDRGVRVVDPVAATPSSAAGVGRRPSRRRDGPLRRRRRSPRRWRAGRRRPRRRRSSRASSRTRRCAGRSRILFSLLDKDERPGRRAGPAAQGRLLRPRQGPQDARHDGRWDVRLGDRGLARLLHLRRRPARGRPYGAPSSRRRRPAGPRRRSA